MTNIEQDIITVMNVAKKGNEGAMRIYYRGNQHLLTGRQRIPFAETAKMSRSLQVESEACVPRQREEHLLKVFRWKRTLYLISKFIGFIKILIIYSCCFFPLCFILLPSLLWTLKHILATFCSSYSSVSCSGSSCFHLLTLTDSGLF